MKYSNIRWRPVVPTDTVDCSSDFRFRNILFLNPFLFSYLFLFHIMYLDRIKSRGKAGWAMKIYRGVIFKVTIVFIHHASQHPLILTLELARYTFHELHMDCGVSFTIYTSLISESHCHFEMKKISQTKNLWRLKSLTFYPFFSVICASMKNIKSTKTLAFLDLKHVGNK